MLLYSMTLMCRDSEYLFDLEDMIYVSTGDERDGWRKEVAEVLTTLLNDYGIVVSKVEDQFGFRMHRFEFEKVDGPNESIKTIRRGFNPLDRNTW